MFSDTFRDATLVISARLHCCFVVGRVWNFNSFVSSGSKTLATLLTLVHHSCKSCILSKIDPTELYHIKSLPPYLNSLSNKEVSLLCKEVPYCLRTFYSFYVQIILFLCFVCEICGIWSFLIVLTGDNWQKWRRVFLTCPCHEIYRDEAAGLKSC